MGHSSIGQTHSKIYTQFQHIWYFRERRRSANEQSNKFRNG